MRFLAFLLLAGLGFGTWYLMSMKAPSGAIRDTRVAAKGPTSGESPGARAPAQPMPPYAPTAPSPNGESRLGSSTGPGATPAVCWLLDRSPNH